MMVQHPRKELLIFMGPWLIIAYLVVNHFFNAPLTHHDPIKTYLIITSHNPYKFNKNTSYKEHMVHNNIIRVEALKQ